MQAIDILMQEHRVIEKVLDSLEIAADRLSAAEDVPVDFFFTVADFIRNFADGCHHQKEEEILFAALDANGMSKDVEPLSIFIDEHVEARRLTRRIVESAERIQTGNLTANAQLVQDAMEYLALLREHIQKEDQVLFPIADEFIPDGQDQQLLADFNRTDEEQATKETYLAKADELASVWEK